MDNLPIIIEQIYAAPVAKVWEALTDKDKMEEWYFDIKGFIAEEGQTFDFDVEDGGNLYHHHFEILEVIPNKKLRHTWTHPGHSKGRSVLTWVLEPVGKGTKVTLIHEGVENFSDAGDGFTKENYIKGWNEILEKWLRNFLEE